MTKQNVYIIYLDYVEKSQKKLGKDTDFLILTFKSQKILFKD